VIDEIADVRPAEVQSNRDAGIGTLTTPVRHLDGVEKLLLFWRHRLAVYRQQQEVDLMDVKFVVFLGSILDRPVFHRSLRRRMAGGL